MTTPFYMDQHVPGAITRELRSAGIDVLTADEDNLADASDDELLDRATDLGRVLVTFDCDFFVLVKARWEAGTTFSSVITARQNEVKIGQCVTSLLFFAEAAAADDTRSQLYRLPM